MAVIERACKIKVEGFDWNCPQHITPRFTADQIQEALAPFERRLQDLARARKQGASRSDSCCKPHLSHLSGCNVAALKKQGRSLNDTVAAKPTAAYDVKWGQFLTTPAMFTALVYAGFNRSAQRKESLCQQITTKDGTQIYYKDWGKGQPIVFSHGWPLSADAWEDQMIFLAVRGYRCIAHDRRGHGRSGQPWDGNDMDTYADDLAELVAALDLRDAIHIGHSTGGGEVTGYIGRHGTNRVAKAVLIGAISPLMLKTQSNPGGLPIEAFDQLRAAVLADRSQFFKDRSAPFYLASRAGAKVSQGLRDSFWMQGMLAGHKAAYDCIKAFSETDLTEDLKKLDVPTLILHGDDDQIVPIGASALLPCQKSSRVRLSRSTPGLLLECVRR